MVHRIGCVKYITGPSASQNQVQVVRIDILFYPVTTLSQRGPMTVYIEINAQQEYTLSPVSKDASRADGYTSI